MLAHPHFRAARWTPLVLALMWLGCSSPLEAPTRPLAVTSDVSQATEAGLGVSASKGAFSPLTVGDHWSYRNRGIVRMITYGQPPPPPAELASDFDRAIVCMETWNGREYSAEETIEATPVGAPPSWRHFRQDASGLYERDVSNDVPPLCFRGETRAAGAATGRAPTIWDRVVVRSAAERRAIEALRARVASMKALTRGAGPAFGLPVPAASSGELTRLRYPLQIKSRWDIRSDPPFSLSAKVEGFDALDLPAGRLTGYRIRLESPAYGPKDVVTMWFGRAGYLQTVAHLELDLVDIEGTVIGIALFDEIEQLTQVQLVTPVTGFPPPLGGPPR